MVVIVFRARLRDGVDLVALEALGRRMYELASAMPGFISYKDFSAQDGEEHRAAQRERALGDLLRVSRPGLHAVPRTPSLRYFSGVRAICAIVFVCACGSDTVAPIDAAPDVTAKDASADVGVDVVDAAIDVADEPAGPFPFFAFDVPRLHDYGGPVLATPKVVPIFFANEDSSKITAVVDFFSKLPASSYWTNTATEYGVGALTVAQAVTLAENAPATIDDKGIESWLANAIATSKVPANEPSKTIYFLYYPVTTTVTLQSIQSCTGFGGYHSETNGVIYAEVNGCASYGAKLAPGETVTGIDDATGLTTHELFEAVTDPFVKTNPKYATIDQTHTAWQLFLYGGEIGDSCEMQPGAFFKEPNLGYTVQRMYSNAAANAGADPCIPAVGTPFVEAWPTSDVQLQLGQKTTVPIHVSSAAPTGPITVSAIDESQAHGKVQHLQLSLDKTTAQNGDTLTLTIQVLATDSSGVEGYWIQTDVGPKRRTAGLVYQ